MPIPDQSFRQYFASFVNELVKREQTIAGFVNATMQEIGRDRILQDGGASGLSDAIGFPHGQVDLKNQQFRPAGNQTLAVESQMTLDYPTSLPDKPAEVAIVEASGPLVLAGAAEPDEIEGILVAAENRHLIVFGDVVTIRGKIKVPGKHVVIFARELRTLATKAGEKAILDTSGKNLELSAESAMKAAASGGTGSDGKALSGWQHMDDGRDLKCYPYNREGSKRDPISDVYPEVGGRADDGKDGERSDDTPGPAGGDIFIVTDSVGPYFDLTVRCSGGNGGRGKQAQDGGNGGPGGDGVDEVFITNDAWGGVDYYFYQAIDPAPGGRGGDGGIGGPGGPGGPSGNCTIVVNKALDENAKIECTSKPGDTGPRGFHGKKGVNGAGGRFGKGRHAETITYPVNSEPHSGLERYQSLVASNTLPPKLADPPPAQWGRFVVIHDVNADEKTACSRDCAASRGSASCTCSSRGSAPAISSGMPIDLPETKRPVGSRPNSRKDSPS
jgi:hypothetical protein